MISFRPAAAIAFLFVLPALPGSGIDYQKDIQPIMKEHCWECHSNEKEVKGGLALDDLAALARSQINPNGVIRPGDPEKSDFVARLKLDEDHEDFMPRQGKALRGGDLAKVEQWIREGALLDAENPSEAERGRIEEVKLLQARTGGEIYFDWTNIEGKVIEAKYSGLEGEAVKITMKNGRSFTVPLDKLSTESAALARKLGGR